MVRKRRTHTGRGSARAPRGRPEGSVGLTKAVEATILNYIRAGAFAYVAAEAAGISARTFREWIARGEGRHHTRKATKKLRAFADAVRTAHAQARLGAEARVYEENAPYWLSRVARSKQDREGWTDPPAQSRDEDQPLLVDTRRLSEFTDKELQDAHDRLDRVFVEEGTYEAPPCLHARCRCPWHTNWRRERR